MTQKNNLPTSCPSCGSSLSVTQLQCDNCSTMLQGHFELPLFMKLTTEELQFVQDFVTRSGNLREMSKLMHLSYPTVRNMLDRIIVKLSTQRQNEDYGTEENE